MIELEFVVPFHGRSDYLFGAVARIRALRDTRWQLTIVEDCDPNGVAVQREIDALGDGRIRYLRNDTRLGVNANSHRCIQLAQWDRFVMPGHDDLLMPDYGLRVAELIERYPDATVVQPHVRVIDERGEPSQPLADRVKRWIGPGGRRETELRGESGVVSLLRGNWLYTPACCYRRDKLQGGSYRPSIDAAHDLAFVVDVLMDGGSIVAGTDVAFEYRRHSASHSSCVARSGLRFEQERRYFTEIAAQCHSRGWRKAELAAKWRVTSRLNALSHVPAALRCGELTTAAKLLGHGVSARAIAPSPGSTGAASGPSDDGPSGEEDPAYPRQ
ncbi:MAG: glycosyltransferase [Sciscionella sp.]